MSNETWVIVQASTSDEVSSELDNTPLTDYHFDSQMHYWIQLHEDDELWCIPISCLVGPAYVVRNRDYVNEDLNNVITDDKTAYVLKPMADWGKLFLS